MAKTYPPWNPPKTTITTKSAPNAAMDARQVATQTQANNYLAIIKQIPAFADMEMAVAINPGSPVDPYVGQPDEHGRSLWSWSVTKPGPAGSDPKTWESINGLVGSEIAQMFQEGVGRPFTVVFTPQKGVSFPGHITYSFSAPPVAPPPNEVEVNSAGAAMLAVG